MTSEIFFVEKPTKILDGIPLYFVREGAAVTKSESTGANLLYRSSFDGTLPLQWPRNDARRQQQIIDDFMKATGIKSHTNVRPDDHLLVYFYFYDLPVKANNENILITYTKLGYELLETQMKLFQKLPSINEVVFVVLLPPEESIFVDPHYRCLDIPMTLAIEEIPLSYIARPIEKSYPTKMEVLAKILDEFAKTGRIGFTNLQQSIEKFRRTLEMISNKPFINNIRRKNISDIQFTKAFFQVTSKPMNTDLEAMKDNYIGFYTLWHTVLLSLNKKTNNSWILTLMSNTQEPFYIYLYDDANKITTDNLLQDTIEQIIKSNKSERNVKGVLFIHTKENNHIKLPKDGYIQLRGNKYPIWFFEAENLLKKEEKSSDILRNWTDSSIRTRQRVHQV